MWLDVAAAMVGILIGFGCGTWLTRSLTYRAETVSSRKVAPYSRDASGTDVGRGRDASRAPLPSESKKEMETENPPKPPRGLDTDPVVLDVWTRLEAIRKQAEPKSRPWPTTGETATTRRKAIRARLKALKSDGHEDPAQAMCDTAVWMYGPTEDYKAKGCRKGGIDSMLRPSNMLDLTNRRTREQEAGPARQTVVNGGKVRGSTTSIREWADQTERVVIDQPFRLEVK